MKIGLILGYPVVSIDTSTTTMASSSPGGRSGAMGDEPMDLDAWSEHVLSIAAERFERRLAQEIAGLEVRLTREMQAGFAAIRHEMAEQRVEMFKWAFLFWVGQFAATAGLLAFMLRTR